MASSVKKKQLIKTVTQVASLGWRPIGGLAVVLTSGTNALRIGYIDIIISPSKVLFSRYAGLRHNSNRRIEDAENIGAAFIDFLPWARLKHLIFGEALAIAKSDLNWPINRGSGKCKRRVSSRDP